MGSSGVCIMGSRIYPIASSPIKSIQRGSASSAGNVTISSVNTSKSFVRSFSTGFAGTVAGTGSTSGTYNPSGGNIFASGGGGFISGGGSAPTYSGTRSLSAGGTSLTSARYGAYLSNSTTLVVDGACRWEVVEYN
jgi:hypothetical protein